MPIMDLFKYHTLVAVYKCTHGLVPSYLHNRRIAGDGCHLRVVPPGQLHRRPSTPKRFCLSAVFIEPGFIYFLCRDVSFSCVFCVCFPVVQSFSPRLLCLSSNSFQVKFFIYSLYIYIYIFFIYFFIVFLSYILLF